MRGLGGMLAAVDILDKAGVWDMNAYCPNAGMTFGQYLDGLETRNLGTGNSRWQTIQKTSVDSANNWGTVARFAMLMIAVVRDDAALLKQSTDLFERYLGDTSKAAAFNKASSYIASWDNTGSASGKVNAGVGKPDSAHPGLDGVVVDDINRGGTGYNAAADYFGATSSGLTYPLEAAEYVWAEAAVLKHMGYPVTTWSSGSLIRMGDWFQRSRSGTGTTNYQYAETHAGLYRNSRWFAGCFKGSATAYGTPPATASGSGGLFRSQPYGDWMCGSGSKWLQ